MPFNDLNLEFEDEEEALKKKKAETLHVDMDLEFQAPDPTVRTRPAPRPSPQGEETSARPAPPRSAGAEIRKIDEARAASSQPQMRRPGPPSIPGAPRPMISGANAVAAEPNYDVESVLINQMRDDLRRVEIESAAKVGIAEFKMEFLTEMLSDMKLLEHQISQILARINSKHPEAKQEVMLIKKLLADFNAKKRK